MAMNPVDHPLGGGEGVGEGTSAEVLGFVTSIKELDKLTRGFVAEWIGENFREEYLASEVTCGCFFVYFVESIFCARSKL